MLFLNIASESFCCSTIMLCNFDVILSEYLFSANKIFPITSKNIIAASNFRKKRINWKKLWLNEE